MHVVSSSPRPAPVELSGGPGPSVLLRAAVLDDAPAFARHAVADLPHLGEHLGWPATTTTEDGAAAFIDRYLRREGGRELLLLMAADDAIVGGTVLLERDAHTDAVELGCWIVAGWEGRGLVRAACVATLAHARRELNAHRVAWRAAADNARSLALARRLGFRPEGRLRAAGLHRGVRQDLDVLSLVGPELDEAILGGSPA
jgi:RimJ/RimL family protein N-acetyltransferase